MVPYSLSRQNVFIDTVAACLFGVTNHILFGFEALNIAKIVQLWRSLALE